VKPNRWLFIGGRLFPGLLIILAVFFTWRYYQQFGMYSLPAFLIIAAVLALFIRSLIRATAVETGVIFAIILALELLLVPAVHVHSDRPVRRPGAQGGPQARADAGSPADDQKIAHGI
jgi:thiol:disulfide interchange protein